MVRTVRRIGIAALVGLFAGAFLSAPARADQAEAFVASATGTALDLSVFGQNLTVGYSTASADSAPKASAEGAGIFAPLQEATHATASAGAGGSDAKPDTCATPPLPEQVAAVVDLGVACGSASADGNGPNAKATGKVVKLGVGADTLLDQLPITEPVEQALEQVLGSLPDELSPVTDTVGDVVSGVLHTQTLNATVGGSTSEISTTAGAVTAVGHAAGAQLDILPAAGLDGAALATIFVGEAKATATYDRASGKASASVDPALVRVVVRTPLTGVVEIPVPVGQTVTILENTPLESTIIAADGTVTNNPDGSVKAVADAVRLELVKGLSGGVTLGLARAEAGAAGSPAVTTPQVETPRELPRTGNTMPVLPVVGAGLMAAGLAGRRFLLARSH